MGLRTLFERTFFSRFGDHFWPLRRKKFGGFGAQNPSFAIRGTTEFRNRHFVISGPSEPPPPPPKPPPPVTIISIAAQHVPPAWLPVRWLKERHVPHPAEGSPAHHRRPAAAGDARPTGARRARDADRSWVEGRRGAGCGIGGGGTAEARAGGLSGREGSTAVRLVVLAALFGRRAGFSGGRAGSAVDRAGDLRDRMREGGREGGLKGKGGGGLKLKSSWHRRRRSRKFGCQPQTLEGEEGGGGHPLLRPF